LNSLKQDKHEESSSCDQSLTEESVLLDEPEAVEK